jgi:sortase A
MWIPAKAELAQWLLERSWEDILQGAEWAPPWPWADTQPVALLRVPGHDVRQLVLAGDSGRNLAFGPALHADLSSRDLVISGHRDTHFTFLRDLQTGDHISIETRSGTREYKVAFSEVVDTSRHALILEPGVERLSLVTCYPFDTLTPGGPLRYVVTALPLPLAPQDRCPSQKHAVNTSL